MCECYVRCNARCTCTCHTPATVYADWLDELLPRSLARIADTQAAALRAELDDPAAVQAWLAP